MQIAPDVLGELREACCDNHVTLRVTPKRHNRGMFSTSENIPEDEVTTEVCSLQSVWCICMGRSW